ncbi:MAG: glycolate oxidase subunit GlcE [Lautropia sp.]
MVDAIAPEDPALVRIVDRVRAAGAETDADGRGSALQICGGDTKRFYGGAIVGEPLSTRELAGISSHEPTELVVTARAGTLLSDLEATLAEAGQCLPFEPPRFAPGGTVGGMVAAGLAGPARASAGSLRDYVLGATLLNGRAEVLSFGGQVMKNVAGYDVSRLLPGSLGILGVVLEVSLKVLPIAQATATLAFEADEVGSLAMLDGWRREPLPIAASSWHEGRLAVRLAGAAAAVEAATKRLGGAVVDPREAAAWWLALRDQTHRFFEIAPHAAAGSADASQIRLWRLSLPPGAGPLPDTAPRGDRLLEWGGAQRWLRTDAPPHAVQALAAALRGHASCHRSPTRLADPFTRPSATLMRVHRNLKAAFDPACLFNRGRLYADL